MSILFLYLNNVRQVQNLNTSFPRTLALRNVVKKNDKYYNFWGSNIGGDSLFIQDSSLNIISRMSLNGANYFGAFIRGSQLVVLGKNPSNSSIFYVILYDLNGNFQSQISIEDNINDFAYNDNRIVLVSNTKTYLFSYGLSEYTAISLGAKNVKLATNNVVLTSDSGAWIYNFSTTNLTTLSNYASKSFISDNTLNFYIASNQILKEYNSNIQVVHTRSIPTYTEIKYKKDYFLFINKIPKATQGFYDIELNLLKITDSSPLYQSTYVLNGDWMSEQYIYFGNIDFNILPNQDILLTKSQSVVKISPNGNILWTKDIRAREILVNNDNSFWIISASRIVSLIHIQNDGNKCVYEVKNPFLTTYCPTTNDKLHQATPSFKGDVPTISYAVGTGLYLSTLQSLGLSFEWYKDGQLVDVAFFGTFRGNGAYKLKIKQENCGIESEEKYVSYGQQANLLSPAITIDKPFICQGKSAIITASCIDASLSWIDNGSSNTTRIVSPNVSTSYFANCAASYNRYLPVVSYPGSYLRESGAVCVSDNSTITVNVYNANQTTTLSGQATSGTEYAGGKIVSTQTIPSSQKNQYRFIKSAELNTNFIASQGSVLTIEAEQGCNN